LARRRRPHRISEDALQEGAAKWWRRLQSGDPPEYLIQDGRVSARLLAYWILQTALDHERETWRTRIRQRRAGLNVVQDADCEAEAAERVDDRRMLDDLVVGRLDASTELRKLSLACEIDPVVRLRALEYSYEEIAAVLGITVGAARVRKLRASERLARILDELATKGPDSDSSCNESPEGPA
jgi:DNA-directed RNA polymerase specialized sigma24 family protein